MARLQSRLHELESVILQETSAKNELAGQMQQLSTHYGQLHEAYTALSSQTATNGDEALQQHLQVLPYPTVPNI